MTTKCPTPNFLILGKVEDLVKLFRSAAKQMDAQKARCTVNGKWYVQAMVEYLQACAEKVNFITNLRNDVVKILESTKKGRGQYGSKEEDQLYSVTLDSLDNLSQALQGFVDENSDDLIDVETMDVDGSRAEDPLYGRLGEKDHITEMTPGNLKSTVFQRLIHLFQKFQRVDNEFRTICDKIGSLLTTILVKMHRDFQKLHDVIACCRENRECDDKTMLELRRAILDISARQKDIEKSYVPDPGTPAGSSTISISEVGRLKFDDQEVVPDEYTYIRADYENSDGVTKDAIMGVVNNYNVAGLINEGSLTLQAYGKSNDIENLKSVLGNAPNTPITIVKHTGSQGYKFARVMAVLHDEARIATSPTASLPAAGPQPPAAPTAAAPFASQAAPLTGTRSEDSFYRGAPDPMAVEGAPAAPDSMAVEPKEEVDDLEIRYKEMQEHQMEPDTGITKNQEAVTRARSARLDQLQNSSPWRRVTPVNDDDDPLQRTPRSGGEGDEIAETLKILSGKNRPRALINKVIAETKASKDIIFTNVPYNYQLALADTILYHPRLIIQAPTGTGKTNMMMRAISVLTDEAKRDHVSKLDERTPKASAGKVLIISEPNAVDRTQRKILEPEWIELRPFVDPLPPTQTYIVEVNEDSSFQIMEIRHPPEAEDLQKFFADNVVADNAEDIRKARAALLNWDITSKPQPQLPESVYMTIFSSSSFSEIVSLDVTSVIQRYAYGSIHATTEQEFDDWRFLVNIGFKDLEITNSSSNAPKNMVVEVTRLKLNEGQQAELFNAFQKLFKTNDGMNVQPTVSELQPFSTWGLDKGSMFTGKEKDAASSAEENQATFSLFEILTLVICNGFVPASLKAHPKPTDLFKIVDGKLIMPVLNLRAKRAFYKNARDRLKDDMRKSMDWSTKEPIVVGENLVTNAEDIIGMNFAQFYQTLHRLHRDDPNNIRVFCENFLNRHLIVDELHKYITGGGLVDCLPKSTCPILGSIQSDDSSDAKVNGEKQNLMINEFLVKWRLANMRWNKIPNIVEPVSWGSKKDEDSFKNDGVHEHMTTLVDERRNVRNAFESVSDTFKNQNWSPSLPKDFVVERVLKGSTGILRFLENLSDLIFDISGTGIKVPAPWRVIQQVVRMEEAELNARNQDDVYEKRKSGIFDGERAQDLGDEDFEKVVKNRKQVLATIHENGNSFGLVYSYKRAGSKAPSYIFARIFAYLWGIPMILAAIPEIRSSHQVNSLNNLKVNGKPILTYWDEDAAEMEYIKNGVKILDTLIRKVFQNQKQHIIQRTQQTMFRAGMLLPCHAANASNPNGVRLGLTATPNLVEQGGIYAMIFGTDDDIQVLRNFITEQAPFSHSMLKFENRGYIPLASISENTTDSLLAMIEKEQVIKGRDIVEQVAEIILRAAPRKTLVISTATGEETAKQVRKKLENSQERRVMEAKQMDEFNKCAGEALEICEKATATVTKFRESYYKALDAFSAANTTGREDLEKAQAELIKALEKRRVESAKLAQTLSQDSNQVLFGKFDDIGTGLDFFGVRRVIAIGITDPGQMKQAFGRARRLNSALHLPKHLRSVDLIQVPVGDEAEVDWNPGAAPSDGESVSRVQHEGNVLWYRSELERIGFNASGAKVGRSLSTSRAEMGLIGRMLGFWV